METDDETDDDNDRSSVLMKHHKPSIIENNFSTNTLVTSQTSNQLDNDSAVLLACNALSCSPRVQDSCVLAAKIGRLEPILLTSTNASEIIIGVLSDNPTDSWSLLTVNKAATTDDSLSTNTDDLLTYIIRISPIYRHIVGQQSKAVDSHHERRTGSTTQQYSFPKTQSKYGDIVVCLTQDDNTTKLKIGGLQV
ncbi:hypothetical protein BY458DRAFT_522762 [Sporodiniella umbellata]|nr:hypothetical protein BY458DRAFT_522762 [Sporodiniella umbellata]